METVEILIYMVVALLIGAMVVTFVANTETEVIYEQVRSFFFPSDNMEFDRVYREDLPMTIFNLWRDCGYGAMDANYTIYAYDNLNYQLHINHSTLFDFYLKYNMCNSLRSESNDCGVGENVEIYNTTSNDPNETIKGSQILLIQCNASSRNLSISTFG